jgi:PEP-CTERM motif
MRVPTCKSPVSLGKTARGLLLAALATLVATPALASPIAAASTTSTTGAIVFTFSATVGWEFTLSDYIRVTSLGVFDSSQDGLVDSHDVGIWSSGGGPALVTGTVPSGTSGTLLDQFRYTSVSALLSPGSYVIGAFFPASGDAALGSAAGFSTAPDVAYDYVHYGLYAGGGSLTMPNNVGGAQAPSIFGPNFQFEVVPEPGALTLVGLGLAGLILVLVRRRPIV